MRGGLVRAGLVVLLGLAAHSAMSAAAVSYADVVVSGAGTPVFNDTFLYFCTYQNIKPYYQLGTLGGLRWASDLGRWEMYNKGVVYYANYSDTPTPPAAGWTCVSGAPPAPSLSGGERMGSPEVIVTPSSGLMTTEEGGQATFEVVLSDSPTVVCPAPLVLVTIGISSSDTSEGTVDKATLSFSRSNWRIPQRVTVSGVDDLIDDGDMGYTILIAAASGGGYDGVDATDVSVTNSDNDTLVFVPAYPVTDETEWSLLTRPVPTVTNTSGQMERLPVVYAFGELIEVRFTLEDGDGLAVRDASVTLDLWKYDGEYDVGTDRKITAFHIAYAVDLEAYAMVIPTDGPDLKLLPSSYEWHLMASGGDELTVLRMIIQ